MYRNVLRIAAVAALILSFQCGPSPTPQPAPRRAADPPPRRADPRPRPPQPPKVTIKTTMARVGLDSKALNRQVDPCKDFYRFACGGWIRRTKIPADKARWVRSFNVIHQQNEQFLKRLLEQYAKAPATESDPIKGKLGRFYRACMAQKAIRTASLKPLRGLLKLIGRVRNRRSLVQAVATLHKHRIWALFTIFSEQDHKDATRIIGVLDQAGLGLPDRDYYLRAGKKPAALRSSYRAHVARMLTLSGLSKGAGLRAAKDVLRIETALARISKTRVQRRNPHKMYNRINRAGLVKHAPGFSWRSYFTTLGFPQLSAISVTSIPFFKGLNKLVVKTRSRAWRHYLRWNLMRASASSLPKRFVDEGFRLRQLLTGQKAQPKRWKRCVAATDAALGELLAQPYVKQRFSAASRQAARGQVAAISKVFADLVGTLDWMDARTKRLALAKRKTMAFLIGYPSRWRKYGFPVGDSFAANLMASASSELHRDLNRVGKGVDRERWEMSPPTVNAYYHPQKNQMVFPAGILQPPFYSAKASIPVNLGAMGMVVGHELTHGFDDQGAKYDAHGNLTNWWAPATAKRFKARTQCVIDQYAAYEAIPGVKVNGKLTAGENIADMGGIKLAFLAYRWLRRHAKTTTVAEGFSEDQQFFLAYAQIWCSKMRGPEARRRAKVDPHSPPQHRVNGPLMNYPSFARAFSCKKGSTMNPKKICRVW